MSTEMPASGQSFPATSSRAAAAPQRVLACVLCQQRKIKCEATAVFPCSHCVKAGAQCVPATRTPRRRRQRFPERELLERLRYYEDLLRQNNIKFEPLHTATVEKPSPKEDRRWSESLDDARSGGTLVGEDGPSREKTTGNSKTVYEAKNFWHAMMRKSQDPDDDDDNENDDDESDVVSPHDDVREAVFKKVWDQLDEGNDHLLFGGSRKTNVDLSTLHPDQVQIFRLWQIYLENVNPLLKVTHSPTLQARIIDAASDVAKINPTLEALMFSIYCISIISLSDEKCRTLFGSSKDDLLTGYKFGCQQALLNCGVLRTGDRDCLTALFIYLVSVRPDTDPRSLSSMLGVALRIAQRMGIHNESNNAKCTALEAEMRRRLWWSLVVYDNRICELSDYKSTMLAPTWDCRTPLNVNDFDIRPEMKSLPVVHEQSTEALFAVVRSEIGQVVRRSTFHLDFTNPCMKAIVKAAQHGPVAEGDELIALENLIEDKYFKFCSPENPLHFMTIWMTRSYFAKARVIELYSRSSRSSAQQTDTLHDAAISHALRMLECDTKIMTSPLTRGYLWLVHYYFPFPAYIHIVQTLTQQPNSEHAEKEWEVMSENYEARFVNLNYDDNYFLKVFSRTVLEAWDAREAVLRQLDKPLEIPRMVLDIRNYVLQTTSNAQKDNIEQPNGAMGMNIDDLSIPMPVDFGGHGLPYAMDGQGSAGSGPGGYPDISGQATMDLDVSQLDWLTMGWNPIPARGW